MKLSRFTVFSLVLLGAGAAMPHARAAERAVVQVQERPAATAKARQARPAKPTRAAQAGRSSKQAIGEAVQQQLGDGNVFHYY